MKNKKIVSGRKQYFYYAMTALVVAALVVSCIRRDLEHIFLCILSLVLFTIPNILKKHLRLYVPAVIEVCAVLFIVCGIVLDGYLDIGLYDTMEDLLVTFVGAVAFNLFAAVYAKKHQGFIWGLIIGAKEPTKHDTEEMTNEV